MSLRADVLREIERRPRQLRDLKSKFRDEKKLIAVLGYLVSDGLISLENGVYRKAKPQPAADMAPVRCMVTKVAKNFGFVSPLPDPNDPQADSKPQDRSLDLFVPGRFLMGAMPGDVVEVVRTPSQRSSDEGKVVRVLEENNQLVGVVAAVDGRLCLLPDRCPKLPIPIKKSSLTGVQEGDKVAAEIVQRGSMHRDHRVCVDYCFGSAESARACTQAILYSNGVESEFPDQVKKEASRYDNASVDLKEADSRLDLRDKVIFTIDGADTKDIDDAISLEKTATGYLLGVHIADVSHYVKEDSFLDEEAYARGTSVYTAGAVIPMLPRQLSNGICSLNPQVDRLCFSCLMELDEGGRLQNYRFAKAVMRSRVKGVYAEINAIFDGCADQSILEKYAQCLPSLELMRKLYDQLAARRKERGCMDIETGEAKILLDEAGRACDIKKVERGVAEQMIEEFMLLANTSAAKMGQREKIPFVYRVHELPDPERVEKLHDALTGMGLNAKFAEQIPTQKELAKLLDESRGTPMERAVHINVLRSMAKAKYLSEPKGHYGLALADYTHFTSPIRRYPDLIVHRMLSAVLAGAEKKELEGRYSDYVVSAAAHCSEREVAAMTSERDSDDCYKAEYMQDKIGQEFEGVISSVTNFGVYVELDNTVEGLVHVSHLSDNELMVINNISLVDPLSQKSWRIGDHMKVKLIGVSISAGNVDFAPA
ncbi:MAG: ribonuclease R [Pygmaiobacter massiliensis]|nr:ribonuclease R [Pygmaiobacter massiliensis]